jgi:Ca2+:H+ antiporter
MVFLSVMSIAIYTIFLYVQNRRHRGFFLEAEPDHATSAPQIDSNAARLDSTRVHEHAPPHASERSTLFHALMLLAYGAPVVILAKQMSYPLDAAVLRLGAPVALGGFIMAVLVLTPESIAAVEAAKHNRLQRSVNVLLGSVLASIGLTIPLVIVISLFTGRGLVLGLGDAEIVMLLLTLFSATLTFSLARTNVLLGCVHLLLFAAYFMLLFD